MKIIEPKIFLIAKTAINKKETKQWLSEIGANNFDIPESTPGTDLTILAGKRCYMSYQPGLNPNVVKVRNDLTAFIDNILTTKHGSILEHVNYTFAIENVSKIFTSEMNRHRAGIAISEGSLRFIKLTDIHYWEPVSIQNNDNDSEELRIAKQKTRNIFMKAFQQMEDNYKELNEVWDYKNLTEFKDKKKLTSLFRRIIGMGVATGGIWSGNLRSLRHIFTMRCSPEAEEEICYVSSILLQRMIEAEPLIFSDFYLENGFWKPKYDKV